MIDKSQIIFVFSFFFVGNLRLKVIDLFIGGGCSPDFTNSPDPSYVPMAFWAPKKVVKRQGNSYPKMVEKLKDLYGYYNKLPRSIHF